MLLTKTKELNTHEVIKLLNDGIQSNELLSELEYPEDYEIIEALASNKNTPKNTLEDLYFSFPYSNVLISLAYNKNSSKKLLSLLADSQEIFVCRGIKKNKNTSIKTLRKIEANHKKWLKRINNASAIELNELSYFEKKIIIHSKNTNSSTLNKLANINFVELRVKIALHKNTSIDTLDLLSQDKESAVRVAVMLSKELNMI